MQDKSILMKGAEAVSLFCRLNIHTKKDLPVRASEMGLLILAVKNEAPVTPVMAADFFKVKKPMITAMVNQLTAQGYMAKTPSSEDRRSFTLTPTGKGAALVEQTYSEYLKTMELLRTRLGNDDYASLVSLIEKANLILWEDRENG